MSVYNDDESESSNLASNKEVQQANIHLTKKKKIIFWIYLAVVTLFFGGCIALYVNAYQPIQLFYSSDSFFFANQVAYEWTLGFVKDVIVTSNSTCPAGYQSAVDFVWPGTGFGCYCSVSGSTFVLEGYCSPSLIQLNCENMVSQASVTANNWANFSNICYLRSTVSMANQQRYNGANNICGSSSSLVIVPNTEPCPIVNISYTQFTIQNHTSIASDSQSILNPIYMTYNSTSPYSFYTYPLIKFTVSQYQFCLMNEDTGINPNHSDFILLNIPRGCSDPGNYTTIDQVSEIDFYSNNPHLQSLTTIAGFPPPGNWIYYLGFGNVPSWSYPCRHNYNQQFSMQYARPQFNFSFYQTLQMLTIIILVAITVLGIEILVVALRRIVNTAVYPAGYKQIYLCGDFMLALSRYIVDILCKLTILGVSSYLSYQSFYNWNWWKSAINFNCHDANPQIQNMIMVNFVTLYNNFFRISLPLTLIAAIMIVIDVVHFCFIYKNELKYYLVESENKMLVRQDEEDLKWMEIKSKDIENLDDKNVENQEFKVTMAQNLFASDQILPNQRIKKKKKKKLFTSKKQQRQEEAKQAKSKQQGLNQSPTFNPYQLEEPPFLQLDSMSNLKPTPDNSKRKKK